MIFLSPKEQEIVKNILAKYPYNFFVFGSRVKGTHRQFSDLDLGYRAIPERIIALIEGDFEESDLPIKVDFVNLDRCSPEFLKYIEKDLIPLVL